MEETSVRVLKPTHKRLESLKDEGQSFDELINEVIDAAARTALWDNDEQRAEYIDSLTEPLRREIAGLQAELNPDSNLSIEDRIEKLEGASPDALRVKAQRLSRERLWEVRGELPPSETREEFVQLSDAEQREILDDLADECLSAHEARQARDERLTPAEYIEEHYGIDPRLYPSEQELRRVMSSIRQGPKDLPDEDSEPAPAYPEERDNPAVIHGVKSAFDRMRDEEEN